MRRALAYCRSSACALATCAAGICLFSASSMSDQPPGSVVLLSAVSTRGNAWGTSEFHDISGDGRYVAFESNASNIVDGDTNNVSDVFLFDRVTQITTRVSVSSAGLQANGISQNPSISRDGRMIAFASRASNLVAGDTNGFSDIFVHDRIAQETIRVSIAYDGAQANGPTFYSNLNGDGKRVGFESGATNLVEFDTNGVQDAFVRDVIGETTICVSVSTTGLPGNGTSGAPRLDAEGDTIAFASHASNLVPSDTNDEMDVFYRSLSSKETQLVSVSSSGVQGTGLSNGPAISENGEYVLFASAAPNLVPGDNNGEYDIFLRELSSGTTERISMGFNGEANDSTYDGELSSEGRIVVYTSFASNIVPDDTNGEADAFHFDRLTKTVSLVSRSTAGVQGTGMTLRATCDSSGSIVAFASGSGNLVSGDLNGLVDVFLRDTQEESTERVSVVTRWKPVFGMLPSTSGDGRYTSFRSIDTEIAKTPFGRANIFLRDQNTEQTTLVSKSSTGVHGNGDSNFSSVSANGKHVAFGSQASNLVTGDTNGYDDVFVHDTVIGVTQLVSVSAGGVIGNNDSNRPIISADGRFVAFESFATNLVAQASPNSPHIYRKDRETGVVERVSVAFQGNGGGGGEIEMSSTGRYVVFVSASNDLVPQDTNGLNDVFLRDMAAGITARISISTSGVQSNGSSNSPDVSRDGRFVAFASDANNLVAGDVNGKTDVFLRDRLLGTTVAVSNGLSGPPNGDSSQPKISANGRFVSFRSTASNLVVGDTNGDADTFMYDIILGTMAMTSVSADGQISNSNSETARLSEDGSFVAFFTSATNLLQGIPSFTGGIVGKVYAQALWPTSYHVVTGSTVSGDIGSLQISDDEYLAFRPGLVFSTAQPPINLRVTSEPTNVSPQILNFSIESKATSPSVRQTIRLFDFDANTYIEIGAGACSTSDNFVEITLEENPERFIGPDGRLLCQVEYKAVGPVFAYPWMVSIDSISWTVR